jgi:DegV family protein with EDD domain
MAKIVVVTDTVAGIPADLVKKYNIFVAPIHIIWDGVDYRDSIDMPVTEFYSRLRKSKTLPTTTSAIQGEFLQIFESLKGNVDGIVTLTISEVIPAACYSSALIAKKLVEGLPIEVIDSRTAMMAQGFSALAAAKVAASGGNISEVTQAALSVASKTHIFWEMDTLKYLRKGGRVSLPQTILASTLQVKPIMGIVNGKVEPLGRARTKVKAIDRLFEMMDERITKTGPLHVAVMHADVEGEAQQVEQKIMARYKSVELLRSEITPVVGTHIGPGAVGLAFYNE